MPRARHDDARRVERHLRVDPGLVRLERAVVPGSHTLFTPAAHWVTPWLHGTGGKKTAREVHVRRGEDRHVAAAQRAHERREVGRVERLCGFARGGAPSRARRGADGRARRSGWVRSEGVELVGRMWLAILVRVAEGDEVRRERAARVSSPRRRPRVSTRNERLARCTCLIWCGGVSLLPPPRRRRWPRRAATDDNGRSTAPR